MEQPQSESDVIGRAETDLRARAKAVLTRPTSWKMFVISTYFVYSFNYLFLFICAVIYFDRVTQLNEHCNDNNEAQCHADLTCHYKDLRENACVLGQPDFDFFLFIMGSWTLTTVTHMIKTYLAFKNLYRHKKANAPQQLRLNNAPDVEAAEASVLASSSSNSAGVGVTQAHSPTNNGGTKRLSARRVTRSDSFASLPGAINRAETGKYQGYTTAVTCCLLPAVWKEWTTEEWGFANRGQSRYLLITDFLLDGLCGFIAAIGYLSLNFITERVPSFPAGMALICSLFILLYTTASFIYWIRKVRYWGPVVA